MAAITVLLVGESAHKDSKIAQRLKDWGAECRFATCCKQAEAFLRAQAFDVVMSEMRLVDGSASRLVPLLEGSSTSLFCSHPVEHNCLWIPIVERGQVCWGVPALWPAEFGQLLRLVCTRASSVTERTQKESCSVFSPRGHTVEREGHVRAFAKTA